MERAGNTSRPNCPLQDCRPGACPGCQPQVTGLCTVLLPPWCCWLRKRATGLEQVTTPATPAMLLAGPHTPTRLPYLDKSFLSYLSREPEISHLREARCLDLHQKGHWKTPKQKHILKKSSLFLTLSFKGKVVRAESKKHP